MRPLHPIAWWVWAAALAAAAVRTTNPIVLLLIVAVVAYVVAARRGRADWSGSFATFLRLGLFVLGFRVALQIAFGVRMPGHVLLTLPSVNLPEWAAGVAIGGEVTAESILLALYEGLRLAVVLACFGAANSLASPYRLMRSLPSVLYEAGVVVTVALAFAPELIITARRISAARRLRGRPNRGIAGFRGLAVPVLEGALERSLHLAASMDARGFGRTSPVAPERRRVASAAATLGTIAAAGGLYGVLDPTVSAVLGLPVLAGGTFLLVAGVVMRGSRSQRTRFRPDLWRQRETVVAASGVVALVGLVATAVVQPGALQPGVFPLEIPVVAPLAIAGVIFALLPAVVAPSPEPS